LVPSSKYHNKNGSFQLFKSQNNLSKDQFSIQPKNYFTQIGFNKKHYIYHKSRQIRIDSLTGFEDIDIVSASFSSDKLVNNYKGDSCKILYFILRHKTSFGHTTYVAIKKRDKDLYLHKINSNYRGKLVIVGNKIYLINEQKILGTSLK
jgi:hypothetical protein